MATRAVPAPARPSSSPRSLPTHTGPALPASPAWLAMGFRPMFLAGATFATAIIVLWLWMLRGGTNLTRSYMTMFSWHVHEMLFGFVMAVISGFLLTAARNWTHRNTLHGYPLLLLVLLWFTARLAMAGLIPLPPLAIASTVVGFQLLLTIAVGRAVVAARSHRNYGIVAMLALWCLAAVAAHAPAFGGSPALTRPALLAALHLALVLIVLFAGRVVPMFSRNRTGDASIVNRPALDNAALLAAVAVALAATVEALAGAGLFPRPPGLAAVFGAACLLSAGLQFARLRTWGTAQAMRIPLLGILHAGMIWLALGHGLLGVAAWWPTQMPAALALHALTIGAIGSLTLGMMVRVTLGHTGRPLEAPRPSVAAFLLLQLATAARLVALWVPPTHLQLVWAVAGGAFALAFTLFLLAHGKALLTARPDGRSG